MSMDWNVHGLEWPNDPRIHLKIILQEGDEHNF